MWMAIVFLRRTNARAGLTEWRFSIESAAFIGYTTFVDFDLPRFAETLRSTLHRGAS
jgi:hypothetical protein